MVWMQNTSDQFVVCKTSSGVFFFFRASAWQTLDKTAAACVALHRALVARYDHPPNNTVRVCWSYCHAAASRRFLCLDPNGFLWLRVAGQYVGGCHVCCDYQGSTDSSYLSGEKCKNMFLVEALVLVATPQLKNARAQSQLCVDNIAQQWENSSWFVFAKTFLIDLIYKCYFCSFCFEALR